MMPHANIKMKLCILVIFARELTIEQHVYGWREEDGGNQQSDNCRHLE